MKSESTLRFTGPRRYAPLPGSELSRIYQRARAARDAKRLPHHRELWSLEQASLMELNGYEAHYIPSLEQAELLYEGESPAGPGKLPIVALKEGEEWLSEAEQVQMFMLYRAAHQSDQTNFFCPFEGLAQQLLLTDMGSLFPSDLRTPMHTFAVNVPEGMMSLRTDEGLHPVQTVFVADCDSSSAPATVAPRGRYLHFMVECGASTQCTDSLRITFVQFRLPLFDASASIDANDAEEAAGVGQQALEGGEFYGREVAAVELRQLIVRLAVNLCLYLRFTDAEIRHLHDQRIARSLGSRSFEHAYSAIRDEARRLQSERAFSVGASIPVDPLLHGLVARCSTVCSDEVVVRGRWERRAYESEASRSLVWLKPFVIAAQSSLSE